jgi:hypothetical protein
MVVATPMWGVGILGAACSGRRTAPWLQHARINKMASSMDGVPTAASSPRLLISVN